MKKPKIKTWETAHKHYRAARRADHEVIWAELFYEALKGWICAIEKLGEEADIKGDMSARHRCEVWLSSSDHDSDRFNEVNTDLYFAEKERDELYEKCPPPTQKKAGRPPPDESLPEDTPEWMEEYLTEKISELYSKEAVALLEQLEKPTT